MGKLHTLRRAIERDPQAWIYGEAYAKRAVRLKDGWVPRERFWLWGRPKSYVAFVKHVLNNLGFNVK